MISENKKYIINGTAIILLLDIIRNLKVITQNNFKSYTKSEFIQILKGYDDTISYLLDLKIADNPLSNTNNEQKNKYKFEQGLKNILSNLNISIQELDDKEDSEEKGKN